MLFLLTFANDTLIGIIMATTLVQHRNGVIIGVQFEINSLPKFQFINHGLSNKFKLVKTNWLSTKVSGEELDKIAQEFILPNG
jgi:hypothetical protein